MQTKRRTHKSNQSRPGTAVIVALTFIASALFVSAPASAQLVAENDMIIAVRSGDVARVEEQFLAGLSANERSIRTVPALIEAVTAGSKDVVALLLERGARVNTTPIRANQTALEAAVRINRMDIAQLLIDAGADVDKAGTDNETPLMIAAKLGHTNMVQLLIDAGAYLNDTDNTGRTPLMLAVERRHRSTVEVLEAAGAQ